MSSTRIDLDELARRESEQVEWKRAVADIDDVVRTLCAFANDLQNLGGGYVVCGAEEIRDEHGFPSIDRVGLDAARLREIQGKVIDLCRERVDPAIAPLTEELESGAPGRRLLVFIQPGTRSAHTFRPRSGPSAHYPIRVASSTIEARNGLLKELLVRKGVVEPWDRRPCERATVDDIDLLALRDALARMGMPTDDVTQFLSDTVSLSPFVPPLCVRQPLTDILRPLNCTVLLFGRDVQRFVPGAFTLLSTYPGTDLASPHAERHELAGTIVAQARQVRSLLDLEAATVYDKNDPTSPNASKYPSRALYEAIGNALAHRDYESVDPTRVRIFEDRVEFVSPGPLPLGVELDVLRKGQARPKWRNQALAWFFSKLQLAQAEGQGIPTILRSMRDEGCPPPILDADDNSVVCTLPAHPRHALVGRLRDAERVLAQGDFQASRAIVREVLQQDDNNEWALRLFGELHHVMREPQPVLEWMLTHTSGVQGYSPEVLAAFADALLSRDPVTQEHRNAATGAVLLAADRRMDERGLRRIGVALNRAGEHERALELVHDYLRLHPGRDVSPDLLQVRGDARLGLAKRCSATAGNSRLTRAVRDRARRQLATYLGDARRDLLRALDAEPGDPLARVITKNLEFLEFLERTSRSRPAP